MALPLALSRAPAAFARRTATAIMTTKPIHPFNFNGASALRLCQRRSLSNSGSTPPPPPPSFKKGAPRQQQQQQQQQQQYNQQQQQYNQQGLTTEARGPVSWKGLVGTGLLVGVMLGAFLRLKSEKDRKYKENQSKHVGKARIGAPWAMFDHRGLPVTSADFRGKFQLLYFGFTNCPDVCPAEMKRVGAVVDAVDAQSEIRDLLQPIFVSVDPPRDSVAEVAEYIADYHPKFVGVVGTPEQVERMCKSFRVFFHKASEISEDDYLIDHSIIMYLMDPNGEFVDFFGTNMTIEDVKAKVIAHLKRSQERGERPWWKVVLGVQ